MNAKAKGKNVLQAQVHLVACFFDLAQNDFLGVRVVFENFA